MIHLTVVTPKQKLVDEEVDEVSLPGRAGYFGVLEGHAPMLSALQVGEISYRQGTKVSYIAVVWGFAEVLPDQVSVLADMAERAQDIDLDRAKKAQVKAETLFQEGKDGLDWERARAAVDRAVVRISVSQKRT